MIISIFVKFTSTTVKSIKFMCVVVLDKILIAQQKGVFSFVNKKSKIVFD